MQCTDHRAVPIPLLVLAVCSFINKHCSLLHSYISSLQSPKGKRHTESCKEAACNLTGSIHFLVFRAVPGTLQNFWEIQEGHQPTQTSSLQSISGQVYQRTTAHCEQLTSDMFDSNLFHNGFRDSSSRHPLLQSRNPCPVKE